MKILYQWWFTPAPIIYDEYGTKARILFSTRSPDQLCNKEAWGVYEYVMAVWKIKEIK